VSTDHEPTIIKLGDTMPSLSPHRGDFADRIVAGMAMRREKVIIVDPHLTSTVRDNVWGAQFQPEFDVEVVKAYTRPHREKPHEEGQFPDALIEACVPSPAGPESPRRFTQLIAELGSSV